MQTRILLFALMTVFTALVVGCKKEPVDPSARDPSQTEIDAKSKRGGALRTASPGGGAPAAPAAPQQAPAQPSAQ